MAGSAGTRGVLAGVALCLLAVCPAARAQDPQPSAARIKAAAEEFDRGRRAYLAKEFEQAAGHFENAYRDAPSKETLRLAIRARRDAKQPARAATLAAVAQEKYGNDAVTVQLAKETLAETSRALSEYDVECSTPCTIAADGRVVSQSDALRHRVFLDPGEHDLGVSFQQGGSLSKHVESKKGTATPLAFEPPRTTSTPSPMIETSASRPTQKPLGPVVFFAAAGLTVAAGAATIVSGIATENDPGPDAVRRQCAGQGPSCPLYQQGQDAETRTNILLGVTIGAAVATAAIGLLFTQWSSSTPPVKETRRERHVRWGWGPLGISARF